MKYLKLFENYYMGAVYRGNKGSTELDDTIAFAYRAQPYDDENVAFDKGSKAFEKNISKNPYEDEQFPNPNLIVAWQRGWDTAKKQSLLNKGINTS